MIGGPVTPPSCPQLSAADLVEFGLTKIAVLSRPVLAETRIILGGAMRTLRAVLRVIPVPTATTLAPPSTHAPVQCR